MRVAVFTDNDFDKVNGVTTTLNALVGHAPADVGVRIYTAAALGTDDPQYLALRSLPVPMPFYEACTCTCLDGAITCATSSAIRFASCI